MTLNFNNKMSTVAVFLDDGKAFDITWHWLDIQAKLELPTSLIISSFLSQSKFSVSVEGEMSTRARVPQGSVLSPTLHNMYINDAPQIPAVYLALYAEGFCCQKTPAWSQLNGDPV
jgi:hypothetical protein